MSGGSPATSSTGVNVGSSFPNLRRPYFIPVIAGFLPVIVSGDGQPSAGFGVLLTLVATVSQDSRKPNSSGLRPGRFLSFGMGRILPPRKKTTLGAVNARMSIYAISVATPPPSGIDIE